MRNQTVPIASTEGTDWKGIGYLSSVLSTLLLGALAWPKPTDPKWHLFALIAGVLTSILGFGLRYFAHLKEQKEIEQAKREAERR